MRPYSPVEIWGYREIVGTVRLFCIFCFNKVTQTKYKPVCLKNYVWEFCCQGNKVHLRSKITKIRKCFVDIFDTGFRDLYKI